MRARRRALVALAALGAASAAAQDAAVVAPAWEVSAGVVHRRLGERADDGRRLVTERGELLRLEASTQHGLARGGALRAAVSLAAGRLDYRGQTQAGVPLATRAGHRDLALDLAWRPLAATRWGEGWLVLHALEQRRQIASTPIARGLRETSDLLLAGVRWRHGLDAAGWRWEPAVEWRESVRHRLEVDFGGVFDTAGLKGGGRREFALGLQAAPAGSAWRFGVEWTRARQSASPSQALTRAGAPAGTVRQPRLSIDDVSLRAVRAF